MNMIMHGVLKNSFALLQAEGEMHRSTQLLWLYPIHPPQHYSVHPLPLFSTVKPKLVFLPEQPFNQNPSCLCYHSKVTHPVSSSYPVKVILQHRDLHGLRFQHVLGQRKMGARARTYECMWKSCIMDDSRLQLGEGGVAGAITRACPWAMDLSYESSPGGDGKQRK